MTRAGTARWDVAQSAFPSTADGADEWLAVLVNEPGVLHKILSDIAKVARATDGEKRTGRRPVVGMGLDQLWQLLYPDPSMDPFSEALAKLLAGTSQRTFAPKVPCNQATISRLLAGEIVPDIVMLERLAAAGGVPPSYFREWRAMKLGQLVVHAYLEQPHLSVTVLKQLERGKGDGRTV